MTGPADWCGGGGYRRLVPSGTNTPFPDEAACVAYFQAGGDYVNFSPPSFVFDWWREQRGNRYTVRWLLHDFQPGAIIPCAVIFARGQRLEMDAVLIGADGAAVLDCGEFRCNDPRGVVAGIEVVLPGGHPVTELHSDQLPCTKGVRERFSPAKRRATDPKA